MRDETHDDNKFIYYQYTYSYRLTRDNRSTPRHVAMHELRPPYDIRYEFMSAPRDGRCAHAYAHHSHTSTHALAQHIDLYMFAPAACTALDVACWRSDCLLSAWSRSRRFNCDGSSGGERNMPRPSDGLRAAVRRRGQAHQVTLPGTYS